MDLENLLDEMISLKSSDFHLSADGTFFTRIDGSFKEQNLNFKYSEILKNLKSKLTEQQMSLFTSNGDVDFSLTHKNQRFRVHICKASGSDCIVIRMLPSLIPKLLDLRIPNIVQQWTRNQNGLVIVTGPTGSGKSTTLASLTNEINNSRACKIVTIEDPVEFHFPKGQALISNREVGSDSVSFSRAVRAALREDADVVVIGEMRDSATTEAALSLAESGHLVFATMHTNGAGKALDRIIDAFPSDQQSLARSRLSNSLLGVVYQRLVPAQESGRIAAFEILTGNEAVKNLIREGKIHHIPNVIQTSKLDGMQTMQQSLQELKNLGLIDPEILDQFQLTNVR